ncbi:MAG: hypothetical protein ACPL7B_03970, partial [Candidatus Poribacteria bacterium]
MNTDRKGEIMLEKTDELSLFWAYDSRCPTDSDLVLLDNVQFIYELSLAELELIALGANCEAINGLREFKIINKSNELSDVLIKRL